MILELVRESESIVMKRSRGSSLMTFYMYINMIKHLRRANPFTSINPGVQPLQKFPFCCIIFKIFNFFSKNPTKVSFLLYFL